MGRRALLVVVAGVVLAAVAHGVAFGAEGTRFREAVRGDLGVIATESPAATEVGLTILEAGGNAVDAAVATVFALNVARPQSCGIGGGGFMVYRGADGETAALDFREFAPQAYTAETLSGPGIHQGFTGHLTVGVPGTFAGMVAANERFGSMPLARLLAPAEALARDGVEVVQSLSEAMATAAPRLRLFPAAAEQFLVGGAVPYPPGSMLVQPDLADTFALLAEQGLDGFYRGPIADLIVDDMQTNAGAYPGDDGLMTTEDLAAYEAKWREPLVSTYRDATVIAMPPPTSGGIVTVELLNLLEGFDIAAAGQSSADHLHLVAESQKIAWADRNAYIADPDHVDVPTALLTSKAYADQRRGEIDPEQAGSYEPGDVGEGRAARPPGDDANPRGNTTHLSVIDAAGNAVALTCTIEQAFGSAVVAPGTGFLLNNELTDFSGPGAANEPGPRKRPRSSISPTIVVRDGQPTLVVGAAGGATIIMGSAQAVINHVDFGLGPARAVDAERIDEQSNPAMTIEDLRVPPDVQADLQRRGHVLVRNGEYGLVPRAQAAGVDLATGERLAASDPRTDWAAAAQSGAVPADPAPPPDGTSDGQSDEELPSTGGGVAVFAFVLAAAAGALGRTTRRR